jgi:hypothetical protein
MGAGHQRNYKRKLERPTTVREATGHTFLIVVEGRATESEYFSALRAKLELHAEVDVIHPRATDPKNIVLRAAKLRNDKATRARNSTREVPYSRVWVVFDTEAPDHVRRQQLPAAYQLAKQEKIRVAVSNLAFELWLLLHYRDRPGGFNDCKALIAELKKHGIPKYAKNKPLPLHELLDPQFLGNAHKHAADCRRHHRETNGDWNPSTRVDRLVAALNAAAAPPFRLLKP